MNDFLLFIKLLLQNYSLLRIFQIIEINKLNLVGRTIEFGASRENSKNFSYYIKEKKLLNFSNIFTDKNSNIFYADLTKKLKISSNKYQNILIFNVLEHLDKYDLAIKYLNDFNSNDQILSALSLSTIGDSFIQLDQLDDGLNYYEKALSEASENTFIKPLLLMKSGNVALELNKKSKARKFFQEIKDDYPDSQQASEIEIKLAQVD